MKLPDVDNDDADEDEIRIFGAKYARPKEWHTKQDEMIREGPGPALAV